MNKVMYILLYMCMDKYNKLLLEILFICYSKLLLFF